jgi:hypothetical protein
MPVLMPRSPAYWQLGFKLLQLGLVPPSRQVAQLGGIFRAHSLSAIAWVIESTPMLNGLPAAHSVQNGGLGAL